MSKIIIYILKKFYRRRSLKYKNLKHLKFSDILYNSLYKILKYTLYIQNTNS